MNWFYLVAAGLCEVVFAYSLGKAREASGSGQYIWYGVFLVAITLSMGLLIKATQTLPMGIAYAVWTGIGAVGTVIVSVIAFKEPMNSMLVFFLVTLIGSIVGLKVVMHG